MSQAQKLSELELRRNVIQNTASNEMNKMLLKNKLTAREKIRSLLDELSFVETGTFMTSRKQIFDSCSTDAPADGVVCGYGTIHGQSVYVYSQDITVLGGSIGEIHAQKIAKAYDEAIKIGVPIIGILDTVGIRLEESIDALQGYGEIFKKMTQASGLIPQIAIVCGECAGGASFIAGLSDFTFISTQNAKMYLNSPNTLDDKNATMEHIAKAQVHLEESGIAAMGAKTEEELIEQVRTLLTYIPQNNKQEAPCYACRDDLNRVEPVLNELEEIMTKDLIKHIADEYKYFELWEAYGTDVTLGFIRLNGATVGVIGNQVNEMDYAGINKMRQFVKFCDAFNIALLTLTNIKYIKSDVRTEKLGIIKEASRLVHTFTNATVPKVNVVVNAAYGIGYIMMNSKHIGADYVYAWPTADIKTMNSESAVKIIYNQELEEIEDKILFMREKKALFEQINSVYGVASRGYIDDIIEPASTRKRVIVAFENLLNKNSHYNKKHPTV